MKRSVLFILVVAAIVISWWTLRSPEKKKIEEPSRQATESPRSQWTPVPVAPPPGEKRSSEPAAKAAPPVASQDPTLDLLNETTRLINSGDKEGAADKLKKALEKDPENVALLTELGRINAHLLHKLDDARNYLEKAIIKDGGNGPALEELVAVYRAQNDATGAASFLADVAAKHPTQKAAQLALADVLVAQGKTNEAVTAAENAIKLKDADDNDRAFAASLYLKQGDAGKAAEIFGSIFEQRQRPVEERARQGLPTEEQEVQRDKALVDYIYALIHKPDLAQANALLQNLRTQEKWQAKVKFLEDEMERVRRKI